MRKKRDKRYNKEGIPLKLVSVNIYENDLNIIRTFCHEGIYNNKSEFIRQAIKEKVDRELELRSERTKWTNIYNKRVKEVLI